MLPDDLYKFMADCDVKHNDPVAAILKKEGIAGSHPMLAEVLRIGFAAAGKRPAYRELRDSLIRKHDPKRYKAERAINEEIQIKFEEASKKASRKFSERIKEAADKFKKTLFEEWMVLGDLPLGKATKDILLRAANKEREVAGEASKRVQFYVKLAAIAPTSGALYDAVALGEVEDIHRRIFGSAKMASAA